MSILAFISSLAWPVVVLIVVLVFRRQLHTLAGNLAERVKHLTKVQTPMVSADFEGELVKAQSEIDLSEIDFTALARQAASDIASVTSGAESLPGEPASSPPPRRGVTVNPPETPDVIVKGVDGRVEYIVQAKHFTFDNLPELAQNSPEGTILTAWNLVEETILDLAQSVDMDDSDLDNRSISNDWPTDELLRRLGPYLPIGSNPDAVLSVINRLSRMQNTIVKGRPGTTKLEAYDYAATALRIVDILQTAAAKRIRDQIP